MRIPIVGSIFRAIFFSTLCGGPWNNNPMTSVLCDMQTTNASKRASRKDALLMHPQKRSRIEEGDSDSLEQLYYHSLRSNWTMKGYSLTSTQFYDWLLRKQFPHEERWKEMLLKHQGAKYTAHYTQCCIWMQNESICTWNHTLPARQNKRCNCAYAALPHCHMFVLACRSRNVLAIFSNLYLSQR